MKLEYHERWMGRLDRGRERKRFKGGERGKDADSHSRGEIRGKGKNKDPMKQ